MTSTVDRASYARLRSPDARLAATAAFALPPLGLLAVSIVLAFRGGGVAADQWQLAGALLIASLFVLAVVGAVPTIPRTAWPMLACFVALLAWNAASLLWSQSREETAENGVRLLMLAAAAVVGAAYAARPRAALSLAAGLAVFGGLVATAIELRMLAGSTSVFLASRLSWPINYANADAALVWLPLPPLIAFAAVPQLRPAARSVI